jgi:hypothetical protein
VDPKLNQSDRRHDYKLLDIHFSDLKHVAARITYTRRTIDHASCIADVIDVTFLGSSLLPSASRFLCLHHLALTSLPSNTDTVVIYTAASLRSVARTTQLSCMHAVWAEPLATKPTKPVCTVATSCSRAQGWTTAHAAIPGQCHCR